MKKSIGQICILFISSFAHSAESYHEPTITQPYKQWFAGPILTPNPITLPPKHPGIEVIQFYENSYGFYNAHWKLENTPNIHTVGPYVDFQTGLNDVVGIELIGALFSRFSNGSSSTNINDFIFRVGFQVLTEKKNSLIPDLRLLIQETFPTGKYRNLNPNKHRTDVFGEGSYQTGLWVVAQKLVLNRDKQKLRLRWALGYFVPSNVNVSGHNFYGGGFGSKGTIHRGNFFSIFFSGSYALTDRWGIRWESNYKQGSSGSFTGNRGKNMLNQPAQIGSPLFSEFSLLPEVGYTFNSKTAIIFGSWLTIAGRNVPAFYAVFVSLLHIF